MNAEEYEQVYEAFRRCRTLEGDDRRAFLDELSEANGAVRAQVEALLGASEDPSAGLAIGAGAARWIEGTTDLREVSEALDRVVEPDAPESVGPFRIVRQIGEGGMGRVYEAEQTNPKRRVALKLVHPHAHSTGLMQRFALEMDVLARLHHPGIAPIYECGEHVGEHGPQPFFAMEFVDGVDVRTFAERAELDVRAKLALVAEIADAVEHAHTKGVVHRDLKPDNVLVDANGRVKVLDFGIARVTDDSTLMRTAVTETGQLIGTLNYMAPEQLGGDSTRVDRRADVYALGVILFELLSGRHPHEVSGLALTAAIRVIAEEEAPRVGQLIPGLARDVETIVGKALEKDPERRYATAGALAGELRRYLARQPITARPPSAMYLARRFTQRHRGLVAGAALALVAIALGFALVVASERREARARANAERMSIDALAASYLATHATLERGDPWAARDQLDRIDPEQRGWEWRWLDARAPLVLEGLDPWHVAIQGRHVAAVAEGDPNSARPLVVVDLAYPEERTIVSGLDGAFGPTNPGGGPILVCTRAAREPGRPESGYQAVSAVVDLPTATVLERIVHPVEAEDDLYNHVSPASLTADGLLAEVHFGRGEDGALGEPGTAKSSIRLTTREERAAGLPGRRSPEYPGQIYPGLTANGGLIRIGNTLDHWCRIVSTADWSDVAILDLDVPISCSLDRKGERVARLREGGLLEVLAVPSLEVLRRFELPAGSARSVQWIGDDTRLQVSVGTRHLVLDADDGTVLEELDNGSAGGKATSSRDGRFTAYRGGRRDLPWIHEFGAPPPAPYTELRGHTAWIYHVAYSPDGSLIASAAPIDPWVRLWDGWTGEPLATLPRALDPTDWYDNYLAPLVFTEDGRTLITTQPDGRKSELVTYDLCTGTSRSRPVEGSPDRQRALQAIPLGLAGRRLNGKLVGHPDGRHVFVSRPSSEDFRPLHLVSLGGAPRLELGKAQGIGRSPEGTLLAVGGIGSFDLLRVADLKRIATHELGNTRARYYAVAWSPDGERLALGEHQGHVTILETRHFRPVIELPDHADYVYSMVWSPDGTRLVTASGDATLRIHDTLHGIPSRLRAEERTRRAEEQLARLEVLVRDLDSVTSAVDALLADAGEAGDAAIAARRACLLRWTRREATERANGVRESGSKWEESD